MTVRRFCIQILILLLMGVLLTTSQGLAQTVPSNQPTSIQDNSFLLEEAYNQESGKVQHISSISRFWTSKDWVLTFTQEWPLPRFPRHQLSFTAAVARPGEFASRGAGLGDFAVNYRYQLVGSGQTRFAFAPRFSLLLPSGRPRLGRGSGGTGFQAGLPFSIVLHPRLATHLNMGMTYTPHARNSAGDRASASSYGVAHSFVYEANPRLNFMLETVWTNSAEVISAGSTRHTNDVLLSPGVRWSYNFSDGLQIVPGLAAPLGVGPTAGERGLIVYLSFEYDMWGKN